MQRLGLCCQFIEAPIRFRTTTAKFISKLQSEEKDYLGYLSELIESNIDNLEAAILFCKENGIGAFRINSQFLPIYTHPEYGYTISCLPDADKLRKAFCRVKKMGKENNVRLTFHPDQYVVLNSPDEEVVKKSIADLEYHAEMAELVGADVINIHGGGGYGDKSSALSRFAKNFERLSARAKALLTIENDDITYTPSELLPLCKNLMIPFVYDVHHHRCLPDGLSVERATEKSLETWGREPLFHISSPKEGWNGPKPRLHHDFIAASDVPKCWREIDPLTVDVEAKGKETAVLKLRGELKKQGWNIP